MTARPVLGRCRSILVAAALLGLASDVSTLPAG
jgi:hypothetical protein